MSGALKYDLDRLAKITIWLIVAYLVASSSILLWDLSQVGWDMERYLLAEEAANVRDWAELLLQLASTVAAAIWIYQASWNARELQPDPRRIRPGWAVGWHFIPFLNLWKPYQAMLQCWNSSTSPGGDMDGPVPGFVRFWWLTWVAIFLLIGAGSFWIAFNAAQQAAAGSPMPATDVSLFASIMIAGVVLNLISSLLFIRLISSITAAQRDKVPGLASVFA